MSNPRDTGRYDAFTDSYVDTNVRVDFAWGNIPMQPNDDRGEDTLDSTLDSHIIATSGYENFPAFTTGAPFDDTVVNAIVPDVVGLTSAVAKSDINDAGLNWSMTTSTDGATALNDDKIKSQFPDAGTVVNLEYTVSIVAYDYVVPGNPIAGININAFPGHPIPAGGVVYMFLLGRVIKPTAGDTITISGNTNSSLNRNWHVDLVENNDSYNTGGTVCTISALGGGALTNPNTNSGGTWVVAP